MNSTSALTPMSRGAAALASLQEQFLSEQRFLTRLSPESLRGYQQVFTTFTALMPTISTGQLSPSAVTEFYRRLDRRTRIVGRGHERSGVKTSTVATYRSKLNRF